jgi:hypothetical protein
MRFRLTSSAVLVALFLQAATSVAQSPGIPRAGITSAFGITRFPDGLGKQCGNAVNGTDPTIAPDIDAGVIVRVRRPWIVQLDTRAAYQFLGFSGCYLVGSAVDTIYDARMSRDLFATSAIRFGVETPRNLPLVRLTAGIGALWGNPVRPIGVLGFAASTRGPHKRFLIEAERSTTRVNADERHNALAGGTSYSRAIRMSPSTFSVRLGMEWGFASKASRTP